MWQMNKENNGCKGTRKSLSGNGTWKSMGGKGTRKSMSGK